ncbi:S8 family serine peptidase [Dactylosporangium aurantiacum]|uniref:S8 family serine peptidase n=1 Tax=Dactylosporangium aurantiacum TaxID=35754 RepID=A0A9Q9IL73_9ACTN|nr:S8 family serine peptidase [Dactylosporangium aurantiacum]MDG6100878.1 S8 family serine peptidase [Dactylosporangium aurantiacum]UWZ55063.1 S8 family serine peptidase [Dactylosporangium aurantiacum]
MVLGALGGVGTAATAAPPPTCDGRPATIVGTAGRDVLVGTPGPDVIVALAGNDIVHGNGGADLICGDAGADVLDGGVGADRLLGGPGNDLLIGGQGSDTAAGGDGNDLLSGGSGDDLLDGDAGRDVLNGGVGADVLSGGDGTDYLDGGAGADLVSGGGGDDWLGGGAGADTLRGDAGKDRADGGAGTDACDAETRLRCEKTPGPGNQPPVLGADTAVTSAGVAVSVQVTANDVDPDGTLALATLAVVTQPAHGSTAVEAGGTVRYTPAAGFAGTDTFTYQLCDTKGACAQATVTVTVTPVTGLLSEALNVDGCRPSVSAVKSADATVATGGATITYDLEVRNDPSGACAQPSITVAGTLDLKNLATPQPGQDSLCTDATPGAACVLGVTIWLEHRATPTGAWTVFPSAAGQSVADGATSAPAGCPGGAASGCAVPAQATYGSVEYPQPAPFAVPGDATRAVPFRFFPILSDADRAAVEACTGGGSCGQFRLASHVTLEAADNAAVTRKDVQFTGADAAAHTLLVVDTLPDGTTQEVTPPQPDLAPGEQITLAGFATFPLPATASGQIVNRAVVRYTDATGTQLTSVETKAATVVEPAGQKAALVGLTDPAAITASTATPVVVSTVPAGTVDGPVQVFRVDGDQRTQLGTLADGGAGGDVTAGDGAYAATFTFNAPAGAVVLQLDATVNGAPAQSAPFTVQVLPAGFPLTVAAATQAAPVTDPATGDRYRPDEALVTFDDAATPADVAAAVQAAGGQLGGYLAGLRVWQVRFPAAGSVAQLRTRLEQLAGQPHVIGTEGNGQGGIAEVIPDDQLYGQQWAPAKARADEAWVVTQGKTRAVTVGVIDTGAVPHADLAGRIAGGWNQLDNSADYTDRHGHGTHVAGIIAANGDNATGVAGACWGCRLYIEKALDDTGHGDNAHLAAAIDHAVSHGAQVISMSVGNYPRDEAVVKALSRAYQADRVVVIAAGNNNSSTKSYPGAYNNEHFSSWFGLFGRDYYVPNLTVAATTRTDGRAGFSNYGDWVDIAAPGVDILSTVPKPSAMCGSVDYCAVDGTSQATPLVAGAAALLRSEHADWSESAVRTRLLQTAKPLPDKTIGQGRLDVFNAVFNAGFEVGSFDGWQTTGTASIRSALGPVRPTDGSRSMALISTGPGGAVTTSSLTRQFRVIPGDEDLKLRFQYDYLTEEYPEYVGTQYNDDLTIKLVTPSGTEIPIAVETVNTTGWTPITGIDFPGGDTTVGQSGWKTASITVPIADLAGVSTFSLVISDRGDAIYDSVVAFDNIQLR